MKERIIIIFVMLILFLCVEATVFFLRESAELNSIVVSLGGILAAILLTIREVIKEKDDG